MGEIRLAKLDDLADILKLYNKNSRELGRYFKSDIIEQIKDNHFYVYVDANTIAGFCSYLKMKRKQYIKVVNLCVDKNYRNKHIATSLLNTIMLTNDCNDLMVCAECKEGLENNTFYDKVGKLISIRDNGTYRIRVYMLKGAKKHKLF